MQFFVALYIHTYIHVCFTTTEVTLCMYVT